MNNKALWLLLATISLAGCTQSHLIYTKNLSRIPLLSVDQLLEESGLKTDPQPQSQQVKKTSDKKSTVTKPKDTQNQSTQKTGDAALHTEKLSIPAQEEFSINLDPKNVFIVLKAIEGDTRLLTDRSDPEVGIFLFRMGQANSRLVFQIYDLGGKLRKTQVYLIQAGAGLPVNQQQSNTVITLDTTRNTNGPGEQELLPLARSIIASLENQSIRQQIRILEKALSDPAMSARDRQDLLVELIKRYISEHQFTSAQPRINELTDPQWKNYLSGLLLHQQNKYTQAMQLYIQTLRGRPVFMPELLSSMLSLYLRTGNTELSILQEMETANQASRESQPQIYAENLLHLASLYEMAGEIDKAAALLRELTSGKYSFSIENQAHKQMKELEANFMDYR